MRQEYNLVMSVANFFRDHLTILIAIAIFIIILIAGWRYLLVAIVALTIAVILIPLHNRMKKHIPAPLSAGILTCGVYAIIIGIIGGVCAVIMENFGTFQEMIISILDWIRDLLHLSPDSSSSVATSINNLFDTMILGILDEGPSQIFSLIGNVVGVVVGFILLFIFLYLFIIMGETLKNDIVSIIPEKSKESVYLMGQKSKDILFSLYVVHVALGILVFILAIPFAWVLSLVGVITADSILLIAVLCGVLALIPMIGAIFVLIFLVLYCLSIGNIIGIIITATMGYFLLCILIDFILRPKLTAKRVKIRPMLVFLGFFGGAAVMGLLGFVLGPIFLVLGVAAYEIFFTEMRKVKKQEMEELKLKAENVDSSDSEK